MRLDANRLISDHIDIRAFGGMLLVKGTPYKRTGPVQWKMGESLNIINGDKDIINVDLTSIVPNTRDKSGLSRGGSMGNKWVLRYGLFQFHGFVNNNAAKERQVTDTENQPKYKEIPVTEKDMQKLLTATWNGTDQLMTTSKVGQKSRLLIKVNYLDNGYIGDLDLMAKLDYNKDETLENITQVTLNLDKLLDMITSNRELEESIEYEYNPLLTCSYRQKKGTFEDIITEWTKVAKIQCVRMSYIRPGIGGQKVEAS
jgi:CRISPR-associated protein Csh2